MRRLDGITHCALRWLSLAGIAIALAGCATPRQYSTAGPAIISAAEWGGSPAVESLARRHRITAITLHHQGEAFPRGRDPAAYLRSLQSWSRSQKHWIDLPYHYVIDLDGKIYAGRNIEFAGDTNTEYDPAGHALIEVVGNFEEVEPNVPQLDAVVSLMAFLAGKYAVPPEAIRGHRDYSSGTVCPGKNLYRYLQNGYFRNQVRDRMARG